MIISAIFGFQKLIKFSVCGMALLDVLIVLFIAQILREQLILVHFLLLLMALVQEQLFLNKHVFQINGIVLMPQTISNPINSARLGIGLVLQTGLAVFQFLIIIALKFYQ